MSPCADRVGAWKSDFTTGEQSGVEWLEVTFAQPAVAWVTNVGKGRGG